MCSVTSGGKAGTWSEPYSMVAIPVGQPRLRIPAHILPWTAPPGGWNLLNAKVIKIYDWFSAPACFLEGGFVVPLFAFKHSVLPENLGVSYPLTAVPPTEGPRVTAIK